MPLPRKVIVGLASVALQLTVAACVAGADPVSLVFLQDAITATPGETVTFQGTFTNDTDTPLYLTSASFPGNDLDPSFVLTDCSQAPCPDDNWLLANGYLDSDLFLDNTSGVVDLFTIAIPGDLPIADDGTYTGTYTVQGGFAQYDSDQFLVNDVPFSITVESPNSSTPEPSTMWLLLPALACVPYLKRHGFPIRRG